MGNVFIKLAEKCEAGKGPDRELDARIIAALEGYDFEREECDGTAVRDWIGPKYTASLDAAMTLVPMGWGRSVGQERMTRACEASVSPPDCEPWGPKSVDGEGSTLALALCAASLRARAAMAGGSSDQG